MIATRFIQIHTLTSWSAVLLNRDDAGMAKRLPYGGAQRLRVSSQCLKRHWRKANDPWALSRIGAPMAVRSRHVVEREIMPSISAAGAGVQDAVRTALVKALYGDDNADVKKRQALLLGQPEIEYLAALARTVAAAGSAKEAEATIAAAIGKGDGKRNLAVMKQGAALGAGLEAALFGRMVTSDTKANTDAAIHVAHAFTVHAEEIESDYFTVVDDLVKVEEDEAGTAGIFETELTSGLFYGYVVIDVGALLDNVGGDTQLAARIVRHLLHMIATVTPGAKKGSTAPYAYADMMLLELGDAQPRSLAGAFRNPVPRDGDVLAGALKALSGQLSAFDIAYGGTERRAALCTVAGNIPGVAVPIGLDALADWAAQPLEDAAR
jgi:CRISPR system Cascade subunit CasC